MLLAGDIGGTKTDLAIISDAIGVDAAVDQKTFINADYSCLEAILEEFLDRNDCQINHAVFGVAGPVLDGQVTFTNLSWSISEEKLKNELGVKSVILLNDLVAIAYAIPYLDPKHIYTINNGEPVTEGTIAVLAPGTGLGEAFLTWDKNNYKAHATEGSHSDFAPADRFQTKMLHYLFDHYDHVSYERVCSGQGIPNIYAFLKDTGVVTESPWVAVQLSSAKDPTPVIIKAALNVEKKCPLCLETLNIFISILAAEAGNLTLKVLATGGIYLGGGILPRILPAIDNKIFINAFLKKGRFSEFLQKIPIRLILNPKAALLGAACYGLGLS